MEPSPHKGQQLTMLDYETVTEGLSLLQSRINEALEHLAAKLLEDDWDGISAAASAIQATETQMQALHWVLGNAEEL